MNLIHINDINFWNVVLGEQSEKDIFVNCRWYFYSFSYIVFLKTNEYIKDNASKKYLAVIPKDEK